MKEPIQLKMTVSISDADGDVVAEDTFIRNELNYSNLVEIQGVLVGVANELQRIAEEKAGMDDSDNGDETDPVPASKRRK